MNNSDYLVILAGSPRGGERTWNSLYKNVLEPLNADLAICCSDKWDQNISLFKRAKYKWIFKELENYSDYYEKNFSGTWKKYLNTGMDTGLYASGRIHFVFKDIIKRNYINILKEYKYIIYSRFDQFYVDLHPEISDNEILIPTGEDYSGLCDRHAAFPSEYAEDFLGICSYIDSEEALQRISEFNNCETTFFQHLTTNGLIKKVKRFKRIQYTASLKGEHTNWRVAKYRVYFYKNLMMKYPEEFMSSIHNALSNKFTISYFLLEPVLTLNYYYLKLRRNLGKIKSKLL